VINIAQDQEFAMVNLQLKVRVCSVICCLFLADVMSIIQVLQLKNTSFILSLHEKENWPPTNNACCCASCTLHHAASTLKLQTEKAKGKKITNLKVDVGKKFSLSRTFPLKVLLHALHSGSKHVKVLRSLLRTSLMPAQ
jgi:hypothetical protein